MARPRKPLAAARLSGAMAKNPQRYRDRREPVVDEPVGDPPEWLKTDAAEQWRELTDTIPWLNQSHRATVAIAARLMAEVKAGTASVAAMRLLSTVLGSLGATPASASRVAMPPPEDEHDDLLD